MSLLKDDVHLEERLNDEAEDGARRWWPSRADIVLLGSVGVADDDEIPESEENCRRLLLLAAVGGLLTLPSPPPSTPPQTSSSSLADENASSMYDTNRDNEPLATDRSGVVGGVCGNEHDDRRSASFAHSSSRSEADIPSDERWRSSSGKQLPTNFEVLSLKSIEKTKCQYSYDTHTHTHNRTVRIVKVTSSCPEIYIYILYYKIYI